MTQFVRSLRNADVPVSPAETLDAVDVMSFVGVDDRDLLKNALALTLAKSVDEKNQFNDAFERFFGQLAFQVPVQQSMTKGVELDAFIEDIKQFLPSDLVETLGHVMRDERDVLALKIQRAAAELGLSSIQSLREKAFFERQLGEALALQTMSASSGGPNSGLLRYLQQYVRNEVHEYVTGQYRLHVDPTGKKALIEAALRGNLNHIPLDYHNKVRSVVERLAQKLSREYRRKRRQDHRGVLDLKRTLRKNMAYDGTTFDLRWKRIRKEQAEVFVVCDVSNSVARIARFLLLFLYELVDVLPRVRAFAFSSQLGEVTEVFAKRSTEVAVNEALFTWGNGNTDYGRAFHDFRHLAGNDFTSRSTLIVLGDARSNYYDPAVEVFKELSGRAKNVFWLNPETREQWTEGDSEMRRYAPFCTRIDLCSRLSDIERFASRLLTATRG